MGEQEPWRPAVARADGKGSVEGAGKSVIMASRVLPLPGLMLVFYGQSIAEQCVYRD